MQESCAIYHSNNILFSFKTQMLPPCQLAPRALLYLAVLRRWINSMLKGRAQKREGSSLPPTRQLIQRGLRLTHFLHFFCFLNISDQVSNSRLDQYREILSMTKGMTRLACSAKLFGDYTGSSSSLTPSCTLLSEILIVAFSCVLNGRGEERRRMHM